MSKANKANEANKTQAQIRDIFQGVKGRLPKSDQELQEWLASPEGKAATMFVASSGIRWGEATHS